MHFRVINLLRLFLLKELLTAFLLLSVCICHSQTNSFRFEHYDINDGLSNQGVTTIFQDYRRFLWVGSPDGLYRFDGRQFTNVYLYDSSKNNFYLNYVYKIREDVDHNLLVQTHLSGILVFNPGNKSYHEGIGNQLATLGNTINDFLVDHHKNIWVMGPAAVIQFDPHFKFIRKWSTQLFNRLGPHLNWISGGFALEDHAGNIWAAWNGQLNEIEPKSGVVYNALNNPAHLKIFDVMDRNLQEDSSGNFWAVGKNDTIFHYDIAKNDLTSFVADSNMHLGGSSIICRNNKIWLGSTANEFYLFDIAKANFFLATKKVSEDIPPGSELGGGMIEDLTGNIWCGSPHGLFKIIIVELPFHNYDNFGYEETSIPRNRTGISDIILHDSSVLISSTNGFYIMSTQNNFQKPTRFIYPGVAPRKFFWTSIALDDLHVFAAGSNVDGGASVGLYTIDLKSPDHVPKKFMLLHPSILDTITVVSFFEDHLHQIWMAMQGKFGVFRWNRTTNTFTHFSMNDTGAHYFPLRHFSNAAEDNNGHLWMGYDKSGIACFDFKSERFIHLPVPYANEIEKDYITALFGDHHGNIWLGTSAGLIKCSLDSNNHRRYTRDDGMASNQVYCITRDNKGIIWMGTDAGITSFNITTNQFSNYTRKDGLPDQIMYKAIFDSLHNRLYFSSNYAIIWFDPDSVRKTFLPLYPWVTSFKVLGNSISWNDDSTTNLTASQNSFSFDFSAPNMINAQDNQYEYMLEGFDRNWVNAGNRNFINYTSLPGGNYSFDIKASTDGHHWTEMKKPLHIHIATLFYKTIWFRLSVMLIFLLIISAIIYISYRIRLQRILFSQTIRNKIAGDLHDEIGSTLSSIAIYSELANEEVKEKSEKASSLLGSINENARTTVESMSDIVWAINPKNDRFENILQRMRTFASGILEARNIDLRFEAPSSLYELKLPMENRKNLYLIFKEAVNNVAKYSGCKNCTIRLRQEGKMLNMEIADDGHGFDMNDYPAGNGLLNMKKRGEEMNGKFRIQSAIGKGTTINLSFPATW
ncbi:MAG TPA: two-component regulator propeller domain-containing protein [Chitinophagales bacterium]|nr:two-component regulator propeller domain-containing protein [Chitinophagales bacterium]